MNNATEQLSVKEYGWKNLKLKTGNRPLKEYNLRKKRKSIKENGYIKAYPIIINRNFEITDGQHRWLVCKELDIEPTVRMEEDMAPHLIAGAGAATDKWTIEDTLYSRADLGGEAAKTIVALCKRFDASPRVIFLALGKSNNITRDAEMSITDDEVMDAVHLLHELRMFADIATEYEIYRHQALIGALRMVKSMPGYDANRMEHRMKVYGKEMFVKSHRTKDQVCNLIDVYNYHTVEENRLHYPTKFARWK